MTEAQRSLHPGQFFALAILPKLERSAEDVARDLGMNWPTFREFCLGRSRAAVTETVAPLLALLAGNTENFWLNLHENWRRGRWAQSASIENKISAMLERAER